MTRTTGETVKLSAGNWIALVTLLLIPLGTVVAYVRANDAALATIRNNVAEEQARTQILLFENQATMAETQKDLAYSISLLRYQVEELAQEVKQIKNSQSR